MSSIDQIRQDYREAVASAIEGNDNLEAWERVRKSLADAIFSAWLIAAAKTAEDIPECELTKMLYAKEGCGAGKEGAGGFQPGNTCAGDGDGSDYEPKYTDGSKSKDTLLGAFDSRDDAWDNLSGKEKKEARWLDHLRRKESENPEEVAREKAEIAKAEQEADDLYWDNRAWIKEQGTDSIAKDVGNRLEKLGFDVDVSGWEGESKYISVSSGGEGIGDIRVADHPMPVGGGFNVEGGARHGEATVSIDPERGIDIDSAIEVIVRDATDLDLMPKKDTHKRTFAKDAFDEMFEMFDMEPTLQAGVNEAALADLEGRVPMLRSAVDRMEAYANELAEELIVAERAGILPFMESTSKGVQAALKNAFWVSDVDHSVVVNIQKLLGDAIRGVMPDDQLQLPEFIKEANLIKAMNLTDARLETIYRTNISTAANEGVMAILRDPEARDLFPLVMITEIKDDRSRPHHAKMDGYITTPGEIDRLKLRPPNGYNCRGSLIKISWDEANDEGWLDDYGNVDMISVRRHNSPEQEGLVAAGIYPDEGFKRGGFFNEV